MSDAVALAGDGAGTSRPSGERQGAAQEVARSIRVLVVDDHELFRRGVDSALRACDDLEVVGGAGSADEAVRLALAMQPDVVLLDLRLAGRSGLEACAELIAASPQIKVIVLTMSDSQADLYAAVRAGASGYLLKEASSAELVTAVRAVYAGQSLISPAMAGKLLSEFASLVRRDDQAHGSGQGPRLTNRELEVLKLVARGLNNKDIANELFISENTVKNHIRNILEKLQLHSRMEAVVYAVREKLLEIS